MFIRILGLLAFVLVAFNAKSASLLDVKSDAHPDSITITLDATISEFPDFNRVFITRPYAKLDKKFQGADWLPISADTDTAMYLCKQFGYGDLIDREIGTFSPPTEYFLILNLGALDFHLTDQKLYYRFSCRMK